MNFYLIIQRVHVHGFFNKNNHGQNDVGSLGWPKGYMFNSCNFFFFNKNNHNIDKIKIS